MKTGVSLHRRTESDPSPGLQCGPHKRHWAALELLQVVSHLLERDFYFQVLKKKKQTGKSDATQAPNPGDDQPFC